MKNILAAFLVLSFATEASAQSLLQKRVSINARNTPLSEVLKSIGDQAGFTFSYNSNVLAGRNPVTLTVRNITVERALDQLLKGTCTYKEVGTHVVLQATPDKFYQVSGYVLDAVSGRGIPDASVYEREQLVSAVTNNEGYFRLRLRSRFATARVSISKELYEDTTIFFAGGEDYLFRLPVKSAKPHELNEILVTSRDPDNFLRNFLSRIFIGDKLRTQTRNITSFIASRPVQMSFVPGIGTHGRLGAQVINRFSLNVLGGYTAGVNGLEIGGLFNIDRGAVRYVQMAGLFNVVGGRLDGLQLGGLSNTVQDSVNGVQAAGLTNYAGGIVEGIQIGGLVNVAADTVRGMQIAGIVNAAAKTIRGTQIGGIANVCRQKVKGTQIAGILNYTHHLEGLQIGLINLADSSTGFSLGLINLSKNGYHKLAVYSDEIVPVNAALKTGTAGVYTILFTGYNPGRADKVFSFGAGLGHQSRFSQKWSLTSEVTVQHFYLGDWDRARLLYRIRPCLSFQPTAWISLFAGPSLNAWQNSLAPAAPDYLKAPAAKGFGQFNIASDWTGWIGWQLGVAVF